MITGNRKYLCATFHGQFPISPFLGKTGHLVHHLNSVLIYLEVGIKQNSEQFNWFVSAMSHDNFTITSYGTDQPTSSRIHQQTT